MYFFSEGKRRNCKRGPGFFLWFSLEYRGLITRVVSLDLCAHWWPKRPSGHLLSFLFSTHSAWVSKLFPFPFVPGLVYGQGNLSINHWHKIQYEKGREERERRKKVPTRLIQMEPALPCSSYHLAIGTWMMWWRLVQIWIDLKWVLLCIWWERRVQNSRVSRGREEKAKQGWGRVDGCSVMGTWLIRVSLSLVFVLTNDPSTGLLVLLYSDLTLCESWISLTWKEFREFSLSFSFSLSPHISCSST